MVSFAATILHRDAVAHSFVHSVDSRVELTIQINLNFFCYTELFQLYEDAVVADKSLHLICSIEWVYAVSPNDAPLNLN